MVSSLSEVLTVHIFLQLTLGFGVCVSVCVSSLWKNRHVHTVLQETGVVSSVVPYSSLAVGTVTGWPSVCMSQ